MTTAYIDRKYIGFISNRLRNFTHKGQGAYCFSHSCESSTSRKKRAYLTEFRGKYFMVCHHCGKRQIFGAFLSETDESMAKDYRFEIYKENNFEKSTPTPPVEQKTTPAPPVEQSVLPAVNPQLIPITEIPKDSFPFKYVLKRNIPIERYKDIFIIKKFNKWASQFDSVFTQFKNDHPRLVIQYKDHDGTVLGYNCRAFGPEQPKYIQLRIDKQKEFFYGLEYLDHNKDIIVVEGQIDSMFIDNAIAVGNASYSADYLVERKDQIIIVPDNDFRRNKNVCVQLEHAIQRGFRVCFLPSDAPKDINDIIIKKYMTREQLNAYIISNVKKDLSAKLHLTLEKRC